MIQFYIPVIPRTKKNSSRIVRSKGRYFVIPSAAYKKFEKECEPYVPQLKIDYPINIQAIYHMPTRHRVDLVNLHEALCDVLVKYGFITDDNSTIVFSMDGSYVMYDKLKPGIEITAKEIIHETYRD